MLGPKWPEYRFGGFVFNSIARYQTEAKKTRPPIRRRAIPRKYREKQATAINTQKQNRSCSSRDGFAPVDALASQNENAKHRANPPRIHRALRLMFALLDLLRQILLLHRGHDYVIGIDHFVEMDLGYFGKQLICIKI